MQDEQQVEHGPWPERALILAGLGAVLGFTFQQLVRGVEPWQWTADTARMAAATFIAVGGVLFGLSLERLRWTWSIAFAAIGGAVVALVTAWNGTPSGWGSDEGWHFFASLIAVAVAVPLFQAARDAGSRRFETAAVHGHVWANVILGGAACVFAGASVLLTVLLAELFSLIGIDALRRMLDNGWFLWTVACTAFGGAVGLLRDRDTVLGTLQKVARAILSVLAPVLALGLVFFVLALPFTGLEPLWEKTTSTTPLLLVCILAAVVLVNATAGNSEEDEARSPLLRWSAAGLIATMLPLAAVAAVSLGKRIGQYGYTPERLWAAVFVLVAACFALGYLLSVVRGRLAWPATLRRTNVGLAAGICALALFLALPIVSFGSVSANDQLARLRDGRTPPERFDWAAMRFDFGPAGRKALRELAVSGPPRLRDQASLWLRAHNRYDLTESTDSTSRDTAIPPLRVRRGPAAVPEALRRALFETGTSVSPICSGRGECLLFWQPDESIAIVVMDGCAASVVGREEQVRPRAACDIRVEALQRVGADWRAAKGPAPELPPAPGTMSAAEEAASLRREREAIDSGDVEIREIRLRRVYIGGKPVTPAFD